MLEETTEPLTIDVYRVLTPYDDEPFEDTDGTTINMLNVWNMDLGYTLRNGRDVVGPDESAWFAHGAVKIEDAREVDTIEGWVTVKPTTVSAIELIHLSAPIKESALRLIRESLADAEQRLDESDDDDGEF